MKLEIPDEFLDDENRTDRLAANARRMGPGRFYIRNRVYNAAELAVRYGCKPYKRKDWQRIAFVSSPCLMMSIQNMNVSYGLDLDAMEVNKVAQAVRLAAGQYLQYDSGTGS